MLITNTGSKLSIQQRVFRNISIHLAIFRLACARAAMRCLSAAASLLRTYCAVLIPDGARSRMVRVHERRTVPTLCEGRLVSGAVPSPTACPLERAARVPRPVCPGFGRRGRGKNSTGPTACALAGWRCSLWGWRKGVPGGGAFHHCEGRLRSGAVPPPTARPLGGLLGSATHVLWARVCGSGRPTLSPWPACPVGAACRGAGGGPSPGGGGLLPPL